MARNTLAIIAAGLGGCLIAASALATTADDIPAVRVAYSDLDLKSDAGVEQLYARLKHAAIRVCSGEANNRELAAYAREVACRQHALDRAVEEVHNPRLTARHKGATATERVAQLD